LDQHAASLHSHVGRRVAQRSACNTLQAKRATIGPFCGPDALLLTGHAHVGALVVRRALLLLAPVRAAGAFLAVVALGAATGNIQAPLSFQAHFATPASYRANPRGVAAITYDPASVPVGSRVRVRQSANKWGGMNVQLDLVGLRHDTGYEAYIDVGLCTADPASAGRHFENFPPSGSYAANEFSFDFETNSAGSASALAQRYWGIGKHQHANSVVIQRPGTGRIAACVTVPFKRLNPGW
jgi:Cu-Zn family superoxide dismutase